MTTSLADRDGYRAMTARRGPAPGHSSHNLEHAPAHSRAVLGRVDGEYEDC